MIGKLLWILQLLIVLYEITSLGLPVWQK